MAAGGRTTEIPGRSSSPGRSAVSILFQRLFEDFFHFFGEDAAFVNLFLAYIECGYIIVVIPVGNVRMFGLFNGLNDNILIFRPLFELFHVVESPFTKRASCLIKKFYRFHVSSILMSQALAKVVKGTGQYAYYSVPFTIFAKQQDGLSLTSNCRRKVRATQGTILPNGKLSARVEQRNRK